MSQSQEMFIKKLLKEIELILASRGLDLIDLQTILELNLIFLLTNKKPTWNTLTKMIGFGEIKNEIFKNWKFFFKYHRRF